MEVQEINCQIDSPFIIAIILISNYICSEHLDCYAYSWIHILSFLTMFPWDYNTTGIPLFSSRVGFLFTEGHTACILSVGLFLDSFSIAFGFGTKSRWDAVSLSCLAVSLSLSLRRRRRLSPVESKRYSRWSILGSISWFALLPWLERAACISWFALMPWLERATCLLPFVRASWLRLVLGFLV